MKQFALFILLFFSSDGFAQQSVFVNDGYGNLYSLNFNNCTARLIGNSGIGFSDIAFTSDGRLWGINNGLYQIDTSDAKATYIGTSFGTGGVSLTGLNDTTLLSEYFDTIYGINVRNAQTYKIGSVGKYYADGDLTWLGNELYMTAADTYNGGYVIKITLNNTCTSVTTAVPINNFNTLTPLCLAITTANIDGHDSLVAFFDSSAYIVSHVDGSYKLLCSNLLPKRAFGAASMSFPSLPIHLINFTSTFTNNSVYLQWQTASEINSNYFSIEKSVDGITFSSIGKVNAAGTSNSLIQYAFTENNPQPINYYRLKEVDKDGKFTYSNILLIKVADTNSITILQNPVQNNLQLQINSAQSQSNQLSIFDFRGRRWKTFSAQKGLQNIDISFLPSGIYILKMISANGVAFEKMFVKEK